MYRGFLKQSTAATPNWGPFKEDDGVTNWTAAIVQADCLLSKNDGGFNQKNDTNSTSHKALGVHGLPLNTTDTNTLGRLEALGEPTGSLAVSDWWEVITGDEWNHRMGTAYKETNVVQVGGVTAPTVDDYVDAMLNNADARTVAGSLGKAFQALGLGFILIDTTIATVTSQTEFTLTAGSPDDDAYPVNSTVICLDASTSNQVEVGQVASYTASTKTVTLVSDPSIFTKAPGDRILILAQTGGTGGGGGGGPIFIG